MNKQNIARQKKLWVLLGLCMTVLLFGIMLFTGKVQYGKQVTLVKSNEYYWNTGSWELIDDGSLSQSFTYYGHALNSIYLKYGLENPVADTVWEIQLVNDETDEVIQSWTESVEWISHGQVKEYVLDTPYEASGIFRIDVIKKNVGDSGIFLLGSEGDTLTEGCLSIRGEAQECDLSIMYSEVRSTYITIGYSVLYAAFISAIFCWLLGFGGIRYSLNLASRTVKSIYTNKKICIGVCIACVGSICFSKIVGKVSVLITGLPGNLIRSLFWCVVFLVLAILIGMRKYLQEKPEIVTAALMITIGMIYIMAMPAEAEVSWDESIHYWRVVALSHANTGIANYAESYLYWHSGIPFGLPGDFDYLNQVHANIQNIYDMMLPIGSDVDVLSELLIVAYIPAAIMLKIGRGLGFPLWAVFKMGEIGSLLLYVLLVYLAMKKLKSGKMVVAVTATIGSVFFLATVYSSDTWIMGWFLLGMAYFFACMQEKRQVQTKELLVIVFASTIAFFPKVIYAPLLLVLLFLPRNKFDSEDKYFKYISAVLASIIMLCLGVAVSKIWVMIAWPFLYYFVYLLTKLVRRLSKKMLIGILVVCVVAGIIAVFLVVKYILPIIVGSGDARGGSGVNAAMQVAFILENPMQYVKILFTFLKDGYLPFINSMERIFNAMGYLGTTKCHVWGLVLLVVVSLTDKSVKNDTMPRLWGMRSMYAFACLIVVCLMSTALYISFTPVGYGTIAGVQQRYILPLIFGLCILFGPSKVDNRINRQLYNGSILAVSSIILLANIWVVAVSQYI